MRERRYLTFDMQNPRHREALTLYSAQPNKLRSEYVVNCILKSHEGNRLEKTIQRVIEEVLNSVSFSAHAAESTNTDLRTTESISDLPDVLLLSLEEI